MSRATLPAVLSHLRRLIRPPAPPEVTDRQLLRRFAADRDEAAFAALVRRHGPLVRGVCRRLLRQEQDAEDAFQATFLVLARKADLAWRDSVSGWLHGVAVRVARKARARAARRRGRELTTGDPPDVAARPEDGMRDLAARLDEELARLPERYRGPLLLCYLEGATR